VALIDGDAVADRDWLIEIQKPFSNEQVGVVGGRIDILNDRSTIARFIHIVRHHQMFGPKEYKNQLIGTNVAYRKAVFDQVGGFHEEFSGYRGEEVCLHRLISQHYLTTNAPDAIVYHNRPESLREWLETEYIDGYSQPLVEQAPQVKGSRLKRAILYLEKLSMATLPIWIFGLLFCRKKRQVMLSGLFPGCVAMARRHLFKQSSREIRQRLREEYHLPLAGAVYAFVDWLSTTVKMIGWLIGLWVHRGTQLSTVYPHGDRIELVIANQESSMGNTG
jgi:GT2 family glycosyltransferase